MLLLCFSLWFSVSLIRVCFPECAFDFQRGNFEPGPEKVKLFLAAMDEMGFPRFVLADIEQVWKASE